MKKGRIAQRALLAVGAAVTLQAVAAPPAAAPIPATWGAFEASPNPEDKRLVSQIHKAQWWDNCKAWGAEERRMSNQRRMAALREYLKHDHTINAIDEQAVRGKRVQIGQTACGVMSILGLPEKVNYTRTAGKQTGQMVYRERGIYVYTIGREGDANGIVRSVQE